MKILGFEFGRKSDEPLKDAARELAPAARPPRYVMERHGHSRSFEVGRQDRLTSSWTTNDQNVNQSLYRHLRVMRARSRDFFRNNEHGRKFASLVKNNVVGPAGFTLKVDARRSDGSRDEQDSSRLQAAYARWTKLGNFDVTGRLTENLFDALAIVMVARDGEVLIRKVSGADRGIHGCQVQLMSGSVLDEDMARELENGNRIRMGVEFDPFMKPVAYWIRKDTGTSDIHGNWTRHYERVPANQIIHLFVPEEINQWRGVPWAYASLRSAKMLDQYQEAAQVAANVGAAKMGFFQQKDPEAGAPMRVDEEEDGEPIDQDRDFISEAAPGQFDVIPDGYELVDWDPDYPHANYDAFVKAISRTIATGCLVSYHALTGDLTEVNFSSIRSGTIDEREMWKQLQGWYIETVKKPLFEWWLERALISDPDLRRLPYSQFDKFNAPMFFGRRWEWVDPKSDIMALRESVALGIKSRAEIIRERGRDPDEVWAELDAEDERGFAAPRSGGQQPAPPPEEQE